MKYNMTSNKLQELLFSFSLNWWSFPWIFPRLPQTLTTMLSLLSGHWEKKNNCTLWTFAPAGMTYMGWYAVIAKEYAECGRLGYSYNEALGRNLGTFIYNTWGTYFLLHILGLRKLVTLSFALFFALCFALLASVWGIIGAAVAILLLMPSPLIVTIFFRFAKPEIISLPIVLLSIALFFQGEYFYSGLVWSLLAFFNLPNALMLCIYLGIGGLFRSLLDGHCLLLLLGMAPGILKISLRLFTMWASGLMKQLVQEQYHLWKRSYKLGHDEYFVLIPFVVSMTISYVATSDISLVVIAMWSVFAFWANFRILYFNDIQSQLSILFCIALTAGIQTNCAWALLPIAYLAYIPIKFLYFAPLPQENGASIPPTMINEAALLQYPCLLPLSFLRPPKVMQFFAAIPDNARFITEFDGNPRFGCAMRTFWTWSDFPRATRHISMINDMYSLTTARKISLSTFPQVTAHILSGRKMNDLARKLGISHVVVYSEATLMALVTVKYKIKFILDLAEYPIFTSIIGCPTRKLFLLEAPEPRCTVEGATDLRIEGSTLRWTAKANTTYKVFYIWHEGFKATINNKALPIDLYKPFAEADTQFMSVRPAEDGDICLTFQYHIFSKNI